MQIFVWTDGSTLYLGNRICDINAIAFDRAKTGDFDIALLQGPGHSLQACLTVGIVLIKHGNPRQQQRRYLLHDFLGFGKIAGANVEDVAVEGITQRLGSGQRSEERNPRPAHCRRV